jgi:shikimate kinase
MGTGKSVVGRRLAKEVLFRFVDTDQVIEERAGKKISSIFLEDGEQRFREMETEVVREVMSGEGFVVSTGGGAVVNQENRNLFCRNGSVVWLTARPEIILSRAQRRPEQRPLLKGGDPLSTIQRLMKERESFYQQMSLFSLDTSDLSLEQTVSKIREMVFTSTPGCE